MTATLRGDSLAEGGVDLLIDLTDDEAQGRLDKALAAKLADLSRARFAGPDRPGALTLDGAVVTEPASKAVAGRYVLHVPAITAAEPAPEDIPLTVLFEDAHLIVVDKPAGMAAHPSPGCETGTLVNALLHHCAGSLSGVGGVARPGIVHRLDKDTSGVMVAAKTDAAHAGLSALFAAHDLERVLYRPDPRRSRTIARNHRHPYRALAVRPEEDGGAALRRPRGGHPLPCPAPVRSGRAADRRARLLPAGDRAHAPDPGPPGVQRGALPRRPGLRVRRSHGRGPRGDGAGRLDAPSLARRGPGVSPPDHRPRPAFRHRSSGDMAALEIALGEH